MSKRPQESYSIQVTRIDRGFAYMSLRRVVVTKVATAARALTSMARESTE